MLFLVLMRCELWSGMEVVDRKDGQLQRILRFSSSVMTFKSLLFFCLCAQGKREREVLPLL